MLLPMLGLRAGSARAARRDVVRPAAARAVSLAGMVPAAAEPLRAVTAGRAGGCLPVCLVGVVMFTL